MIKHSLLLWLLFSFFHFICHAQQPTDWKLGLWLGHQENPYACIISTELVLNITSIEANTFKGTVGTYVTADPSKKSVVAVAGHLYADHLTMKGHQVLERVEPSPCHWISCEGCDSTVLTYSISNDNFHLNASFKCAQAECISIIAYSRRLNDFTPAAKKSLEKMISGYKDTTLKALYNDYLERSKFKPLPKFGGRVVQTVNVFNVNSDSATIFIYDSGVVDGDSVSIFLNGHILRQNLKLRSKADTLIVKLEHGADNQIIFQALNLGSIPINTAYLVLKFDGQEVAVWAPSDLSMSAGIILRNQQSTF